jgi:murein L,D-transpeptidase YafK
VLAGLAATAVAGPAAAEESATLEEVAVEGLGKLGAAAVEPPFDAEGLERRLAAKGMKAGSPVFIRIFKEEAELELWVDVGGRFELFATYPICNWSGTLGPKLTEGDGQSPEGLYSIGARQLHYSARWRRALDLGFPNTFDRSARRTGSDVLLHGGCTSTGCFAMTDRVMAEIFSLSQAALAGDKGRIEVHAFPFRMTPDNLAAHELDESYGFWADLKEAYDLFERTRVPPAVGVCNNRYAVGEAAVAGAGCVENVATVSAPVRRGRFARSRARGSALKAYAAARKARMAAKQRQAAASQRKVSK